MCEKQALLVYEEWQPGAGMPSAWSLALSLACPERG